MKSLKNQKNPLTEACLYYRKIHRFYCSDFAQVLNANSYYRVFITPKPKLSCSTTVGKYYIYGRAFSSITSAAIRPDFKSISFKYVISTFTPLIIKFSVDLIEEMKKENFLPYLYYKFDDIYYYVYKLPFSLKLQELVQKKGIRYKGFYYWEPVHDNLLVVENLLNYALKLFDKAEVSVFEVLPVPEEYKVLGIFLDEKFYNFDGR